MMMMYQYFSPGNIFINPTPQIVANEGSDIQFSCLPFDATAPLILEINGLEVDPAIRKRCIL